VSSLICLAAAAGLSVLALRYSGPIARRAIHTPWLADVAAILVVFAAAYLLLRLAAGALTRRVRQTSALSGIDRTFGAGFGLVRAVVILGLANLAINAVTPAERMPRWISGALLYPVSSASARTLKSFAPEGERLATRVAAAGRVIADPGEATAASGRRHGQARALQVSVEKSP